MSARRSSRRAAAAVAALAVAIGVAGCAPVAAEQPSIVVTTNILGDVVGELVGEQAMVTTLMRPNADPHSFEISAQEAAGLESADLVVANGLGLEEGLEQHVAAAEAAGVPIVEAGDHVDVLEYSSEDAAGADPHFWTDPTQMRAVVDALRAAIAEHVHGIDVTVLDEAAAAYGGQLDALDADLAARFGAIPEARRAFVTNHHVFGYLAERYGFRLVGAVVPGGTTLAAPSASDLADLAGAIRDAGVPVIFAESSQPDRLVQVLAEEAGLEVRVETLFTESLTGPGEGAETYLEMLRANADRIEAALA
ncbi:zinc ABC transporter substrate-binding protein AztC [Agrococcus jenensis]|uniref:Zinc/manganese transport system substrate-binding protein n=1 Tax=Agrococcus jenensis TaxID=46353 RepID=A0A3N2ARL8_9MICO|nr:zinc ABC transporter substrate-binding protein AztC [Agrococcus jenensis]ROR65558.1 zinc/manganese transport system substrate-binding protein [Agrococcus jenensis]